MTAEILDFAPPSRTLAQARGVSEHPESIWVAEEILRIAKRQGYALNPMQLIKLCVIAQGWSLAILDRPLFDCPVEAWAGGPVVSEVYRRVKFYGIDSIPFGPIDVDRRPALTPESCDLLQQVFQKYGHFTSSQLFDMTSAIRTPWHRTWMAWEQSDGSDPSPPEVPTAWIKEHYLQKLADAGPNHNSSTRNV